MEYFSIDDNIGVRSYKNNHIIYAFLKKALAKNIRLFYIFEGYYNEPYEQGDNIHIKIEIK